MAHTMTAGTSNMRNRRYCILLMPATNGMNAPAAVAYRPMATVLPPWRRKYSSAPARRPDSLRTTGRCAMRRMPYRRPSQYPVDSPHSAATVPMKITAHSSRSPLLAYTPPSARMTSPGTISPMRIERSARTPKPTMT